MTTILTLPKDHDGVVVEAGCFKGSSTAKFSLAAEIAGRELVVFDSFQGLPEHEEQPSRTIFGKMASFTKGSYRGSLTEVVNNVNRFGRPGVCRFVEGWFQDTMPHFKERIAAAYLDVDLVASTRCCLKHLYPLLLPGAVLYSQDGHLESVVEVYRDDQFWQDEIGCSAPHVEGLGRSKLVRMIKKA